VRLRRKWRLSLFKPFIFASWSTVLWRPPSKLREEDRLVEQRNCQKVWDIPRYVIREAPVLLNLAPTPHRLRYQAFEPLLAD